MKKIKFKNFQGHENSTITLADTITSITGKSTKGKSSIVRGIEMVRSNSPRGSGYIRTGATKLSIDIDGVVHERTKRTTKYIIGDDEPTALNGAVPESVTEALNIGEENIQDQHEPPFLIGTGWTPGKVAQKLSELIDLESPNKALKDVALAKRKLVSLEKDTSEKVASIKNKLKSFNFVEEADAKLSKLERKEKQIKKLEGKLLIITTRCSEVEQAELNLSELPDVSPLIKTGEQLISNESEISSLTSTLTQILRLLEEIDDCQLILEFDPSELIDEGTGIIKLNRTYNNLINLIKRISELDDEIEDFKQEKQELEKTKKSLMGDTCLLCGSTIHD